MFLPPLSHHDQRQMGKTGEDRGIGNDVGGGRSSRRHPPDGCFVMGTAGPKGGYQVGGGLGDVVSRVHMSYMPWVGATLARYALREGVEVLRMLCVELVFLAASLIRLSTAEADLSFCFREGG